MLKKELIDFVKRFETPKKLKEELLQQVKDIVEKYKVSEKYLEGFTGKELLKRKMQLVKKRRQTKKERLEELSTDVEKRKEKKKVKSKCISKINKILPDVKMSEFSKISQKTGIPTGIIKKVVNKGQGAFHSSGSRPGMTSKQWGLARLACFLAKKKSVVNGPDKNLYEKAITKSKKAKDYFRKI